MVPKWKTLILEDKEGAWLGRILYSRKTTSLRNHRHSGRLEVRGAVAGGECWRDVWYDQLKQQISQTQTEAEKEAISTSQDCVAAARLNRFLTKAVPSYNEGEESGIENCGPLQIRVPLEILRPVDQLMEEMSADQAMETAVAPGETLVNFASKGTKKQHSSCTEGTFDSMEPSGEPDLTKEPYHPFDSQDEFDQEVEDEKISHINRGFDISGYSTSQWQEWVTGKRFRSLGLEAASAVLTGRPRPKLSA